MKSAAAQIGAAAAVILCVALQLALGPRWQAALVQVLGSGLLLSALLGFARIEAWPAFGGLLVTVICFDAYLTVTPPLPGMLISLYTALTVIGTVVYISVYESQFKGLLAGFADIVRSPAAKWHRLALLVLAPLWFASVVLAKSFPELAPPLEARTVHPEPPNKINAFGESFDMLKGTNPFRELKAKDPEKFKGLAAEGKRVYYQNCFYCHGDDLSGKGHFAAGFNPKPANFQDIGTIAMLQESFVYWRVVKGGPGMPAAGQPWSSAMPVWEDMLSQDDIWKAILYIYEGTGHEPRSFAAHESH